MGTVSVNLVGQAPSGTVYRLRDAVIVVQGPTSTQVWSTEDNPGRTSLSANVASGVYHAALSPGWRIERVEGLSTTTVPAELVTPNPAVFGVDPQQRTTVPLTFRVFHEEVDLSQGYDLVIGIEECTAQEEVCTDGQDGDCDGDLDCDDSDCAAEPSCAVCGDGQVTVSAEQCDDGNLTDFDGCSSTCQAEAPEVEPNEDGTPSPFGGASGNDFATASADANGAFSGAVHLMASISPAGDEDVYAFDNPTPGPVAIKLDTWNPALGIGVPCGSSIDTVITIRDAAGNLLGLSGDRDGAADRCSNLVIDVNPGQRIYLHILELGDDDTIPSYGVTAEYFSM